MPTELKLIIFVVASAGILYVSRASLRSFGFHGFYRFFAWGVFLKSPSWPGGSLAMAATAFLAATAKVEETENTHYFGSACREYMKQTKMFIPFLF